MPLCKDCESHFIKYQLEIAGKSREIREELPSLYHLTPTCPECGLIGDIKKTKLRDALYLMKESGADPETITGFMAFYRKRSKDFSDGYSLMHAFLREGN